MERSLVTRSSSSKAKATDAFWHRAGSAWPHKDGKGLNMQIPTAMSRLGRRRACASSPRSDVEEEEKNVQVQEEVARSAHEAPRERSCGALLSLTNRCRMVRYRYVRKERADVATDPARALRFEVVDDQAAEREVLHRADAHFDDKTRWSRAYASLQSATQAIARKLAEEWRQREARRRKFHSIRKEASR